MKRYFTLLIINLCVNYYAQDFYYKNYNWQKQPTVFKPSTSDLSHDLVFVCDKSFFEVAYEANGQPVIYETKHTIYHVNNIKAIDAVNKGYISTRSVNDEIELKARVITLTNKIIYFNKETVKRIDNYENEGPFTIFAIDGVEVGCDVEILYTNKKQFNPYMSRVITAKNPIEEYEVRLISPKNLVYDTKCYNGINNFIADTSNKEKNQLVLAQKNIGRVKTEKYSAGDANCMGYIIQLAYNSNKKTSKTYTWETIAKDYYNAIYTTEKNEMKAVEKFLDKNKISKLSSNEEKIKAIESILKINFELNDGVNTDLEKSIDTKKINYTNTLKFYATAFKKLSIPFEVVLTNDRTDFKFDSKLASYIFIKDYLIYINELNKYFSPINIYSRLGYPNPYNTNCEAVFIKEVSLGDLNTASSKIKFITAPTYSNSYHNYNVTAQLDFDKKEAKLIVEQNLFGYSAYYIQPVYRYFNTEQKEENKKNYMITETTESIKNFEIQNVEEKDVFTKPMLVKYTIDQNEFLENAGNKFIFKVGLLIGPQAQLYQEGERKNNAEIVYTHSFKRDIEIVIPNGYKATNLKDLELNTVCRINDKDAATFKSTYSLKDNKIIVTVYEDYQLIDYPLANFEKFKDVINAAADFNKKNIIFEKN